MEKDVLSAISTTAAHQAAAQSLRSRAVIPDVMPTFSNAASSGGRY